MVFMYNQSISQQNIEETLEKKMDEIKMWKEILQQIPDGIVIIIPTSRHNLRCGNPHFYAQKTCRILYSLPGLRELASY